MATKSPTTTTTTDTAPVTDTAQTEVIKAPAAPAAPAAPTPFDGLPQELFRLSVDGSLLQVEAKIDGGWVIAAEFNMIGRNSPVLLTRSDLGCSVDARRNTQENSMAAPEYKLFPGIKPSEASWFCVTNLDGFEIAAAYDVMRRCDPAKFAAYFSDSHVLTNLAYMYPELMKTFPDLPWNRMRIAELNKKQAVMSDDEILAQFSGTVEKASFARKPVADAVQSVLGNQIRLATEAGQLVQQADATVRTEKQTATQND